MRMAWLGVLLLTGCGHVSIEDYRGSEPAFSLQEYFTGQTRAWGLVQNYRGQVVRRFSVDLCGYEQGGELVLDEDFVYDDGETQFRQWRINSAANGQWQGRADDIIGVAEGEEAGFALQWAYQMDLEVDGSQYRVSFDDWMYRLDEQHVFNRADIKKWGVTVAEVTLFFDKLAPSCQPAERR